MNTITEADKVLSERKCIICGKSESDFEKNDSWSEEHIIPEALGGDIKINDCCKKCNSLLGETIDANFVNDEMTEIIRLKLKIKGKKNIVPNPFKKEIDNFYSNMPDIKGHLIFNENGDFEKFDITNKHIVDKENFLGIPGIKGELVINDTIIPLNNTENCFVLVGNKGDEEELWKAAKKNTERNDRHPIAQMLFEVDGGDVSNKCEVGWTKEGREKFAKWNWSPELVKIAYEITYFALKNCSLGEEYLADPRAKDMQKFLKAYIYEETMSPTLKITLSDTDVSIKDVKKDISIRWCCSKENTLCCRVNIFNYAWGTVVVADDAAKFQKDLEKYLEHLGST